MQEWYSWCLHYVEKDEHQCDLLIDCKAKWHRTGAQNAQIAFAHRALRLKGRCAIQDRRNNKRRPPPQEGGNEVGCKFTAHNTQTARRSQSRPWPDGKCPPWQGVGPACPIARPSVHSQSLGHCGRAHGTPGIQ